MKNKTVAYIDTDSCIINDSTDEVRIDISEQKFKERAFDIIDTIVDQVITQYEPKNEDDLEYLIVSKSYDGISSEFKKYKERELDFVYLWTLAGIIKNIADKNYRIVDYGYGARLQKTLIKYVKRGVKFRYV